MALTGTLEDFGIAEILQLIGQQAKSGVLQLRSREDAIQIGIADGSIVSAEAAGRRRRERLGALLVRAELLAARDLEAALAAQRRTMRRLGDLLIEMKLVSRADLRQMTALQTTETLYRLFDWKSGTYAFEPGPVEWDAETVTPIRAEALLMEGFRRVDEWPMIRRRIPTPRMTFERRPPPPSIGEPSTTLGPVERRVLALAEPGRTVERIADLSRLGEFEASKALLTLVNLGLLLPVAQAGRSGAGFRAWAGRAGAALARAAASVAATAALALPLAVVAALAVARWERAEAPVAAAADAGALRFAARAQLSRLEAALEVWRLEHGEYPPRLSDLLDAGLVQARDLRHPFPEDYYYRRRDGGGFILLPPLP
jgi:hypothetical protein